jgi:pilus assembly protein CpaB
VETTTVVVARDSVARFTALSADMLTTRDYPKDLAPSSAASHIEDLVGRVTQWALVPDEPVLESKLAPRGGGGGMAAGVTKDLRAFAIQTTNVSAGVAGFILPGNKVDVLLTVTPSGNDDTTGGGSTSTLLQNVEVLAVDQRIDAPPNNKADPNLRSVTLLVTPRQVEQLTLGQMKGTLHLSLRNSEDVGATPLDPVTMNQLNGRPPLPGGQVKNPAVVDPPLPTPVPPVKVRTLRGTQGGVVDLD